MIARVFHDWERRLASVGDRSRRPAVRVGRRLDRSRRRGVEDPAAFLETLGGRGSCRQRTVLRHGPARDDYELTGDRLTFPSAIATPHPENNIVRARFFPDASPAGRRARGARAAAVERRRRRPRRPVPAAQPVRDQRAAADACPITTSACRPSSAAPTTSSARTSAGRRRSAGRRCSTRGARSPGWRDRATSRSASSAPAWARACRC